MIQEQITTTMHITKSPSTNPEKISHNKQIENSNDDAEHSQTLPSFFCPKHSGIREPKKSTVPSFLRSGIYQSRHPPLQVLNSTWIQHRPGDRRHFSHWLPRPSHTNSPPSTSTLQTRGVSSVSVVLEGSSTLQSLEASEGEE